MVVNFIEMLTGVRKWNYNSQFYLFVTKYKTATFNEKNEHYFLTLMTTGWPPSAARYCFVKSSAISFKCLGTDPTKTFNFNKRQPPPLPPPPFNVVCHFSSDLMCFGLKLGGEQYIKRKLMNWGIQKCMFQKFPNFDIFSQYQGGRPP
jgi:hypothetical protein